MSNNSEAGVPGTQVINVSDGRFRGIHKIAPHVSLFMRRLQMEFAKSVAADSSVAKIVVCGGKFGGVYCAPQSCGPEMIVLWMQAIKMLPVISA